MRISGNYTDRLLITILPMVGLAFIIIHFTKKNDLKQTMIGFLIATVVFWTIDTTVIFFKFKKPKALKSDATLVWGNRQILPNDIYRIRPITDNLYRWSFSMIEVSLTDGTNFFLIDKPNHFFADIFGKPSKTLTLLTKEYPELDEKITGRHFI
jgi:hypothetical protein